MKATADGSGFVPVFDSRFFTDDVPHGLCVLLGLAELVGVETPQIVQLIRMCQRFMGKSYVTDVPDASVRGIYACRTGSGGINSVTLPNSLGLLAGGRRCG